MMERHHRNHRGNGFFPTSTTVTAEEDPRFGLCVHLWMCFKCRLSGRVHALQVEEDTCDDFPVPSSPSTSTLVRPPPRLGIWRAVLPSACRLLVGCLLPLPLPPGFFEAMSVASTELASGNRNTG